MISYKVKGIILVVILSLASIMMPFSVYADSYVSPSYIDTTQRDKWQNAGGNVVNFSEDPLTGSTPSKLTFTFNDNYYGFVSFQPFSGSQQWNDATCFIAGGVGYYNYRNVSNYNPKYIDGVKITYVNLFLPDSNVDLSQIISILTAIENDTTAIDTTTDSILTDLQSVLNQVIISNNYLNILTQIRQYNIPFESYSFVLGTMRFQDPVDIMSYKYNMEYPMFLPSSGQTIFSLALNAYRTYYLIFIAQSANESAFASQYSYNSTNNAEYEFTSYETISTIMMKIGNANSYGYLVKTKIKSKGTSNANFNFIANSSGVPFIPIYFGLENNEYLSTDFALQFGLSNQLLDDLHIIANGTTQSNSAASDLESEASEYSDIADDVIGVEEGLTSNFETEVNKIDLNTGLNGFGGNFMTSATWVRTQFDRLTENTPYGSLVVYGLTLGFALLMLGKVFL